MKMSEIIKKEISNQIHYTPSYLMLDKDTWHILLEEFDQRPSEMTRVFGLEVVLVSTTYGGSIRWGFGYDFKKLEDK